MKNLIFKLSRIALILFGFSAAIACLREEYGTPYSTFEVKCKVIDSETKREVKGIMLTPGDLWNGIFDAIGEGVKSDTGIYELKGTKLAGPQLYIKLTDLDPKADGHYKDSIYVVPIAKIEDSKKNWITGTYATDVTLEAEQVKNK